MMGFLQSHFLAMTGGYIYRHTPSWEGFTNYVKIGASAMIYMPGFIKIDLAIQ
jgi:hypothetical protein